MYPSFRRGAVAFVLTSGDLGDTSLFEQTEKLIFLMLTMQFMRRY